MHPIITKKVGFRFALPNLQLGVDRVLVLSKQTIVGRDSEIAPTASLVL